MTGDESQVQIGQEVLNRCHGWLRSWIGQPCSESTRQGAEADCNDRLAKLDPPLRDCRIVITSWTPDQQEITVRVPARFDSLSISGIASTRPTRDER